MLRKNCLLLVSCLLITAFETPLWGQAVVPTPFRTETEAARHKAGFLAAARAAGYTQWPEFFYRNRLDVTKTKALRHIGVDMLAMDRSMLIDGPPDYPTAALVF